MSSLKFSSASRRSMFCPHAFRRASSRARLALKSPAGRHALTLLATPKQASADRAQITLLALNALPYFLCLLLSLGQIVFDFAAMVQVVSDNRIYIGKTQRRVALHDRLRRCAVLECPYDQLQEDARISDTQSASRVLTNRGCFGLNGERHITGLLSRACE